MSVFVLVCMIPQTAKLVNRISTPPQVANEWKIHCYQFINLHFFLFVINLETHISIVSEEEGVGKTTLSNSLNKDCSTYSNH